MTENARNAAFLQGAIEAGVFDGVRDVIAEQIATIAEAAVPVCAMHAETVIRHDAERGRSVTIEVTVRFGGPDPVEAEGAPTLQ